MIPTGVTRRPPIPQREVSQHDELIKFINEAWIKVNYIDFMKFSTKVLPTKMVLNCLFFYSQMTSEQTPATYYKSVQEEPRLNGFQPFDLDSWWGRRVVQNFEITRNHQ